MSQSKSLNPTYNPGAKPGYPDAEQYIYSWKSRKSGSAKRKAPKRKTRASLGIPKDWVEKAAK